MPPRRPAYTQADIDAQLQAIHLLDPSSTTENLEGLGTLVKSVHDARQQDAFLRTVKGLIESKDADIEKICGDNYQDFAGSVSTLLTVRTYTVNLRDRINSLDQEVSQVGHGLASKKKALLKSKRTAGNLDEAIGTLQSCLRVLDMVNKVGEMIRDRKYWSALRTLEEIRSLPFSSISQTPFLDHILASLPSLRAQIKGAVTSEHNSWLLTVREVTGEVGNLALTAVEERARRWRARRDREGLSYTNRVGCAVELVTNEKVEYDILNNDRIVVDFKPLYQSIHIHTALDALDEFQRTYQADRAAQSSLILTGNPATAANLLPLLQQLIGFFVIESHVLRTTSGRGFRTQHDVDELWDGVMERLVETLRSGMGVSLTSDQLIKAVEHLTAFQSALEEYAYDTSPINGLTSLMFEKYTDGITKAINGDDNIPMDVSNQEDAQKEQFLMGCFVTSAAKEVIFSRGPPQTFPFSRVVRKVALLIKDYAHQFYQFVEGVSQPPRNVDQILERSLGELLSKCVAETYTARLGTANALSQVAQMLVNVSYLRDGCAEVDRYLTTLRSGHRGHTFHISATDALGRTLQRAESRISAVIAKKLDDFEPEYDWTTRTAETQASLYIFQLVSWLTTVVDSLDIEDRFKAAAYRNAMIHVSNLFMDFLSGRNITAMSEGAIRSMLVDVDFMKDQFESIGRPEATSAFKELRMMTSIVLNNSVPEYLQLHTRQTKYPLVSPSKLQVLLEKLARFYSTTRTGPDRERADKYRRDADAVSRMI
ncbi:Exocyst complex component 6B AltName: Full=Exocyst complex component Sec15B [Rhizoctonia solani AG-1 IB]|uniref:Exocyst complex component SEC15 n=1 Tax=Thanatephorus cucumeris (strain AG1-IB / isolate 7/3/14) TaxID=1108050 RepID=M5BW71_THACB|nr:Exocyst complex component 6B AltName: Full=Exocyst complex component Sec15B [Rhizoctonia solani AG-1 IB]